MYNKISAFSDEISSNVITQFETLSELGIKYFEPRGIDGKNISELNDEEVVELKEKMQKYGIKASSIGSPVGKIKLTDDFAAHFEVFKRCVKTAKMLDCRYIRIFSFYHDGTDWTDNERKLVFERLSQFIDYAKKEDVVLLHENEKDIYGDVASRCLDLMEELYCDNFKAVFDPANFIQSAQNTKEAFEILKPYIAYMHIKDAMFKDGSVVPAGHGDGDVRYILESIFANGYSGFLSLEPHLGSFDGLNALELNDKMTKLEKSDEALFEYAYSCLSEILKDVLPVKKVKLGIIGCGNMGFDHVKNLMSDLIPGMELSCVCDIDSERRKLVKDTYPELTVFEDAEEAYKSGLCDTVLIAVPHYYHPSLAIKAFEHGLNVITEKPAGVYTKQVKEMNSAAEKSGKLFGIMYNQRTNPVYQKLRQMIKGGELGHIKRITWIITNWYRPQAYHDSNTWRSTWSGEGGGTLINQNPHQLDLWQWLFGVPDRVLSKVSFGKYYDIEVEDDVMAYFEYDNGTTGEYITSTGEFPGTNRLEIACDMGKIVVEDNKIKFWRNAVSEREFNKTNKEPFGNIENESVEIPCDFSGGEQHVGILKDFANVLQTGGELLAKGEEGIFGLTVSNAIHLSAWTGRSIDVKNFPDDEFYELLQDKIRNSSVKKKVNKVYSNTSGTY